MTAGTIFIKNIYYMLAYVLDKDYLGASEPEAGFENGADLFAFVLSKLLGYQIKHGLARQYVEQAQDLRTVRGKIDLAATLRHRQARRTEIACVADELTENNPPNQIIKTAAQILIRYASLATTPSVTKKAPALF